LIFINLGYLKFGSEKTSWIGFFKTTPLPAAASVQVLALIQIVGGLMLLIGFFTQIAALVFVIITSIELFIEKRDPILLRRGFVFYLLLFAISLSLLLTGAGFLAIDLPL
jgi:uncharacterized membrane protein YphA (DoxX/SURF4 family)